MKDSPRLSGLSEVSKDGKVSSPHPAQRVGVGGVDPVYFWAVFLGCV